MPVERPYRILRDSTLEKLYEAVNEVLTVESMLQSTTVQDLTKLSADLSLERSARLAPTKRRRHHADRDQKPLD